MNQQVFGSLGQQNYRNDSNYEGKHINNSNLMEFINNNLATKVSNLTILVKELQDKLLPVCRPDYHPENGISGIGHQTIPGSTPLEIYNPGSPVKQKLITLEKELEQLSAKIVLLSSSLDV